MIDVAIRCEEPASAPAAPRSPVTAGARPKRRRSAAAGTFDAQTVLARLREWAARHGARRAPILKPAVGARHGPGHGRCRALGARAPLLARARHRGALPRIVGWGPARGRARARAARARPLPPGAHRVCATPARNPVVHAGDRRPARRVSAHGAPVPRRPALHGLRDAGGQVEFGAVSSLRNRRAPAGNVDPAQRPGGARALGGRDRAAAHAYRVGRPARPGREVASRASHLAQLRAGRASVWLLARDARPRGPPAARAGVERRRDRAGPSAPRRGPRCAAHSARLDRRGSDHPPTSTVVLRFGTWTAALAQALE